MRKLFFLLLFSSTLTLTTYSQISNAVFRPKGQVSGDIENANREEDPRFAAVVIKPDATKLKGGTNNKNLSQLDQGMEIMESIVDRFIQRDYSFSLLSGHKYMINSCLGLKVSSGQFDLKFANPVISTTGGKFSIKLKIDKIKFSALKVRSRPRVPDFSDPDPCHFSGKFEIGGEATDVSVRVTMDLIAVASTSAAGYCALAFGEPVDIKWTIGGFNLRPMPNALDNMGKEMVEDALNNGMTDLVYNRLMDAARAVLPEYFDACEDLQDPVKNAVNSNATDPGGTKEKWTTKNVTGLRGNMGRLNLDFPAGIEWDVDIYSTANKFIINRSSAGKHPSHPLAAGSYNIRLNTVPVEGIQIEEGKETRISWGVLDITTLGPWELRTANDKFLTSGNKPKKLALPTGNYLFREGENTKAIVIRDQQEELVSAEEETDEKWRVQPGGGSGVIGNLDLRFPPDAEWVLAIFNEGSKEYVETVSQSNNRSEAILGAGKYKLVLNNVPVEGVPIEGEKTTVLKVAVLNVKINSSWSIWDEAGANHFKTENGATRMIFPVGKYVVKFGGSGVKVELKEGEVVEL